MAPWAIVTDTRSSVRIPAAWNGVTALKTTIGRISTFGVLPLSLALAIFVLANWP
jgi:aspartyl-tRNA(Asn)/glutamyl-tRNA(Gln) amidotransferase subunit A